MTMDAKKLLAPYAKFSVAIKPSTLLSGDIDRREGEIVLVGKKSDGLSGAVKRRLLSDINRHFHENPKDVDDTRLIFEANETASEYEEKGDGTARLVLRIKVGLASNKPGGCRCC